MIPLSIHIIPLPDGGLSVVSHPTNEPSLLIAQRVSEFSDMVLVGKMQVVERRMNEFYPNMGKATKSSAGTGTGSSNRLGREAGSRADVGNPKIAAQNRKRIE